MRDLLFKCPGCAAGLAFDRKLAGKELSCPSCKGRIAVPVPDASFECPSCKAELHAPADASGEFECPSCKGAIVIEGGEAPAPEAQPPEAAEPERQKLRIKERSAARAPDAERETSARSCPRCHALVGEEDVICVRCGTDLRTGGALHTDQADSGKTTGAEIDDYGQVPWYRKSSVNGAMALGSLLLAPLLWFVCWNCLTGEVYYSKKRDKDGRLKTWGRANRIAAVILLLIEGVFIVWQILALIPAGPLGSRRRLERSAVPIVADIIKRDLGSDAKCAGVTLARKQTNGTYQATASLDDGNKVDIMIEENGEQIQVEIPDILKYLVGVKKAAETSGDAARIERARKMVAAHTRAMVRHCLAGIQAENPTQDVAEATESVVGLEGIWRDRAELFRQAGDDGPREAIDLCQKGVEAYDRTDYLQAINFYASATEKDAGFPWAFNNLAWALSTSTEKVKEAFRYSRTCKAIQASQAEPRGLLGGPEAMPNANRKSRGVSPLDDADAVETAKAALDIVGVEYWGFAGTLAAAYARSGDFDNAVRWQEKVIAAAPGERRGREQDNLAALQNRRTVKDGETAASKDELDGVWGRLRSVVLPEFDFRDATLRDVTIFLNLAFRQQVGPRGDVVFFVDASRSETEPKEVTASGRRVPFDQVVERIAKASGCELLAVGDTVFIGAADRLPQAGVKDIDLAGGIDERMSPRVEVEMMAILSAYKSCADLIRAHRFRQAASAFASSVGILRTAPGREAFGILTNRLELLVDMKTFVVRRLTEEPMKAVWRGGASVLGADEDGVRLSDRKVAWGEVDVPQMLGFIEHAFRKPPTLAKEHARLALAASVMCAETGQGEAENKYLEESMRADLSIGDLASLMALNPSLSPEAFLTVWIISDARAGVASAQCALGIWASTDDEKKDEAAAWFRKAAEQGHVRAQVRMGFACWNGDGVTKDAAKAAKWFRKAAEQGDAIGAVSIAECYRTGEGVARDPREAAKWCLKAAEQGNEMAQCKLALMYMTGEGVPESEEEGLKWMRKAAAGGCKEALDMLEERGRKGETVVIRPLDGGKPAAVEVPQPSAEDKELAKAAYALFGDKKDDPRFSGDADLLLVANAIVKLKARTVFPTMGECDDLLAACQRAAGKKISPEVQRAVAGAQVLIQYERDMLGRGYQRYGGVFMDPDSIEEERRAAAESRRAAQAQKAGASRRAGWRQANERVVQEFGDSSSARKYADQMNKQFGDSKTYHVKSRRGRWIVYTFDR